MKQSKRILNRESITTNLNQIALALCETESAVLKRQIFFANRDELAKKYYTNEI
jgi:hypothetical protein